MNSPRWDGKRWRIQVRKDGRRLSFSSSVPGVKGRRECQRKYESWLFGEGSGEKSVNQVSKEFLEDVKARRGENSEAFRQYERYIRLYIAPRCGQRKICKMTLRDWQGIINGAEGQNKPLSEKTLKNLRGIIVGIIKFGYEDFQCELPRGDLYIPRGHSKKEKEILQKRGCQETLRAFRPLLSFAFRLPPCYGTSTGRGTRHQIGRPPRRPSHDQEVDFGKRDHHGRQE